MKSMEEDMELPPAPDKATSLLWPNDMVRLELRPTGANDRNGPAALHRRPQAIGQSVHQLLHGKHVSKRAMALHCHSKSILRA